MMDMHVRQWHADDRLRPTAAAGGVPAHGSRLVLEHPPDRPEDGRAGSTVSSVRLTSRRLGISDCPQIALSYIELSSRSTEMAADQEFRVIVATDGSDNARDAVTTARHFPWPAVTRVGVVVARRSPTEYRRSILLTALDRGAEIAADHARRVLTPGWPDLDIVIVDKAPVTAVLDQAKRFGADVIVVGWRGHGAVRRALMGSVSRGIVRGAACSVLVVRQR